MRLSRRSFPYPVIGNENDVDASFQATIDPPESDGVEYAITVHVQTSSETLLKLVADSVAKYVLHVECGATHFRRTYDISGDSKTIRVPAQSLSSTVELNVMAIATRQIKTYRVKRAHADYEGRSFLVPSGGILAVSEGQSFDADIDFDAMQRVDSIVRLKLGDPSQDIVYVDLDAEKISIELPPEDFELYKKLKMNSAIGASLIPSLVVPALVEAITMLAQNPHDPPNFRWARCIIARMQREHISLADNTPFEIAQRLLKGPIRRAFSAASQLMEGVVL